VWCRWRLAASCDPRHLFLDLLSSSALSITLDRNISTFRARGTTAKVNLALSGPPQFSCRPDLKAERIRIGETIDDLERAFDPVKYRRFADNPALDILVPTIERPELAPKGHHVLSILVQCAPYDLARSHPETPETQPFKSRPVG
jgi:phytoene dehydrogenase-like protein